MNVVFAKTRLGVHVGNNGNRLDGYRLVAVRSHPAGLAFDPESLDDSLVWDRRELVQRTHGLARGRAEDAERGFLVGEAADPTQEIEVPLRRGWPAAPSRQAASAVSALCVSPGT
jgi:hypothetical protein